MYATPTGSPFDEYDGTDESFDALVNDGESGRSTGYLPNSR